MTRGVVGNSVEISELTTEELDVAGRGMLPLLALAPYLFGGFVVGAAIAYLLFVT